MNNDICPVYEVHLGNAFMLWLYLWTKVQINFHDYHVMQLLLHVGKTEPTLCGPKEEHLNISQNSLRIFTTIYGFRGLFNLLKTKRNCFI